MAIRIKRITDTFTNEGLFSGVELKGSFGTRRYDDTVDAKFIKGGLKLGEDIYRIEEFAESVTALKAILTPPANVSLTGGAGIAVDATDPKAPIVNFDGIGLAALPTAADNTAALAIPLAVGQVYKTSAGALRIVV